MDRHSAEEIVAKLRQADVLLAQGQMGADVAVAPENRARASESSACGTSKQTGSCCDIERTTAQSSSLTAFVHPRHSGWTAHAIQQNLWSSHSAGIRIGINCFSK
jgi:hypothetical protein